MSTRVKICGITNLADALAAVEAGADALGFNFYEKSPRHRFAESGGGNFKATAAVRDRVGVFVNAPEDFVLRAIGEAGLTMLQFHGDEPPEFCTQFRPDEHEGVPHPRRGIVEDACRITHDRRVSARRFFVDDKLGGTGEKFNWDLAVEAQKFGKPIFLAGGLTPENVAEAVRKVRPFARGCFQRRGIRARQKRSRESEGVHPSGER